MKKNSIFRKARLLAQKGYTTSQIIKKLGLTREPRYLKHRVASAVSYELGKKSSKRVVKPKTSLVEFCLVPSVHLGLFKANYAKVYLKREEV